jgi:hypothetical protein
MLYKRQVKLWNTSNRRRNLARFAAVGLMLSLWLGTSALAVSPQLHLLLHQDSHNIKHECFVTQLSKGSALSSQVVVTALAPPLIELSLSRLSEAGCFSVSDYRLSPSRAPPSFIASNVVVG